MRVLVCPDKFRGSLTAVEAAQAVSDGLRSGGIDGLTLLPIADGGEGTVDCAVAAGFERVTVSASDAAGRVRGVDVAVRDGVAVVESALACGHDGVVELEDPALAATSYGLGQVIVAALDIGVSTIVLGVGGTASTDGGAGMLQALGATLRDADEVPVGPGGGALASLARVNLDGLDARLTQVRLVVATDVANPLTGEHGAARMFGPQKGASPDDVAELEANLVHLAAVVRRDTGIDVADLPGAGAGGGIGYGLLLLGAQRVSGADFILDLVGFEDALADADLLITGEGRLDAGSLLGKTPVEVARRAFAAGVHVAAVAGVIDLTTAQLAEAGIKRAYAITDRAPDTDSALREATAYLKQIGEEIARSVRAVGPGVTR